MRSLVWVFAYRIHNKGYILVLRTMYLRVFMVYRNAGYGTLLILNKSAFHFWIKTCINTAQETVMLNWARGERSADKGQFPYMSAEFCRPLLE